VFAQREMHVLKKSGIVYHYSFVSNVLDATDVLDAFAILV
jgi:hypothetical protein